jgi:DNA-binding transcriptional LysR family regulator
MELYQLRYFLSVATHRNITRAAAESGITQTAMSEQMRKLEASLGTLLLHRGRRLTTLTPAGAALVSHAETIFRQLDATRETISQIVGLSAGRLTLGAIPSVCASLLPGALKKFRTRHPSIQLTVREDTSARIAQLVESGEIDVGIAQLPIARGAFTQQPLLQEAFRALVSNDHPLSKKTSLAFAELANENLILPRGRARQSALEACRTAGFEPRLCCESAELETIRALVAANLGIALLPSLAAQSPHPGTKSILLSGRPPKRRLVVLTPKKSPLPEPGARFLEVLRAQAAHLRPQAVKSQKG